MKEKHKLQIPHFGVKNHSYEIGKILEDFHYTVIIHDQEYFMSVQIEILQVIKPGLIFKRANLKEILEEILSVALLSPACFLTLTSYFLPFICVSFHLFAP